MSIQRDELTKEMIKEVSWHALNSDGVLARLNADADTGLTASEAQERYDKFGPNSITQEHRKSFITMFLAQFKNPLVIILIIAAFVTIILQDYLDAGVILAVVLINAIIGFIQEHKAVTAIDSLSKLLTVQANVMRDGRSTRIGAEELVPGDLVILQSGDRVPADIRIVTEKNFQTDESALTGESVPVSKGVHSVGDDVAVSDRVCMAFSGTLVTAGSAKGIAVATGDATQIGMISSLIVSAPEITTPLTRKLAKFGLGLSLLIVVLSIALFATGVLMGKNPGYMFSAAVAIAVAVIPEGLPAIVTIVLAVGVKRMVSRNAIIRSLPSVETLGSVTVICSDKTGTLTANEMTVHTVFAGGNNFEFTGIGYDPTYCCVVPVDTNDEELETSAFKECMRAGLLCNDSELQKKDDNWTADGDPTEVALITSAIKAGLVQEDERRLYPRLDVFPFESANMYMGTLNATPEGNCIMYVKGSIEQILRMCDKQMFNDQESNIDSKHILHRAENLAEQGFRVMAFARKIVPSDTQEIMQQDMNGLTFLGLQAMSDPARPEAIESVRLCKEAGISVKMITGDHVITAMAIARDLGIGGRDVKSITGTQLAALSDEEFSEAAFSNSVFARVAPEQKYRLVEALQAGNEIVAMTGDGVNDAPALKKADVGVGMGATGSEVAKDAADMVLTDDNFSSIVAAVEEGRTVFANITKTLAWILPTSLGQGLVIVAALIMRYTLPVTPVQVLWINTVTAVTLALPLAFESKEPGIMQLKPRNPNAPLLDGAVITRIFIVAVSMVIGAFIIFLYEKGQGASINEARTAAVATIVAYEVFYLFSARSERIPVWKTNPFSNPYIWVGVFLVTLFQLAFTYLPSLNHFFGSAPLPWNVWLRVILVSFPIMFIVGIEKAIRYKYSKNRK